jgi:hypothetical protein
MRSRTIIFHLNLALFHLNLALQPNPGICGLAGLPHHPRLVRLSEIAGYFKRDRKETMELPCAVIGYRSGANGLRDLLLAAMVNGRSCFRRNRGSLASVVEAIC